MQDVTVKHFLEDLAIMIVLSVLVAAAFIYLIPEVLSSFI